MIGGCSAGGNLAPSKGGNLTVECGDIVLGNVYGGANRATVDGNTVVKME